MIKRRCFGCLESGFDIECCESVGNEIVEPLPYISAYEATTAGVAMSYARGQE